MTNYNYCDFCDNIYPEYTKYCTICKRKLIKLDKKIKELVKLEIDKM